jgi:methylenetetrahydrofolate--tRNA-(uracil-5-)-methyltransferase
MMSTVFIASIYHNRSFPNRFDKDARPKYNRRTNARRPYTILTATRKSPQVIVVGAGLAGSEAAWQAAQRGLRVRLYEMRPTRATPAHQTDGFAELVCSNSLGSNAPDRALGLLKAELRRLGSLNIACADATALPAGDALAVDREAFSRRITAEVSAHPNIEVVREEVVSVPEGLPTVIATGPLTSPALADAIRGLAGEAHLYFYDAMAPIVAADGINFDVAFRANRYSRSRRAPDAPPPPPDDGDYINCPFNRDEYFAFVEAVNIAEKISLRDFEQDDAARRYFEGCLPIEVLAARDPMALAFGPMRPVGLTDPRTGRRPFAVVQLRQDNVARTLYNIVGFQTNLKWGDQERVLRMIPGLERAEFVRFGQMHRNVFINSPGLLLPTLQWRGRGDLFFAGQVTGTEGYVGSTAGGWLAGVNAARVAQDQQPVSLPPATMFGALIHYITHAERADFQPMKANFGLLPEHDPPVRDKQLRHAALVARATLALDAFLEAVNIRPISVLPHEFVVTY